LWKKARAAWRKATAVGGFIGEELGEGEAAVVVVGDVKIFPTGAADVIALAVTRGNRKVTNDTDRLRKYLARFDLTWSTSSSAGVST
jgi:sigma54-dependent transcription regulator